MSELIPIDQKRSNNTAELTAIIKAVEIAGNHEKDLVIFTDSQYSIWVANEPDKHLNKPKSKNKELIQLAKEVMTGKRWILVKVKGHDEKNKNGEKWNDYLIDGNVQADLLATACVE